MTIYYQHIGERLSARDFPRSLGTLSQGLRRFRFEDVEEFLRHLNPLEIADIKSKTHELAPSGFQIWGIPSGAQRVLKNMHTGDYLMLLESTDFAYCGQVIHRTSDLCHDLSYDIWGEQRFPIIIILQGELISYGWDKFVEELNFAANYHMRGNTSSISAERIAASKYGNEEAFMAMLLTTTGTNPTDQAIDFRLFSEGLQTHLRLVKERHRDHQFRDSLFKLQGSSCAFCGLDVPVTLEAAHIVPKHENGTDDPRNGLILCAIHHRMFDANVVGIDPENLAVVPDENWDLARLRITQETLAHLRSHPHVDALKWKWARFQRVANE